MVGMTKIFDYFTSKTDIDSKIMACNILVSEDNYDDARQQISAIRSLGTLEAANCADVFELYVNSLDTTLTKEMLKEHCSQLENYISDNNYLYSGVATALYEYAFDTLIPEYTPIYEEEMFSKQASANNDKEESLFIIYPNPTRNLINIEPSHKELNEDIIEFLKRYGMENIENCETIYVNIYDISSHLLYSKPFNYSEPISIDIHNYVPGTYIVEIKSCLNSVLQSKIIKI